jgi:predicted ester cyclase
VTADASIAETNKAVVRRYIAELNRRNLDILEELVSAEFRETVRGGYQRNVEAFPDYFVQIHDMIAEGDQVVVEWSHRGVHRGPYDGIPPTGKTITGRAISIYRVIDGRITDARGIWDRGEVLEQLAVISRTDKVRGT